MKRRACVIRHRNYELQVRREAEALRDAGFAVDVICMREPGFRFVTMDNGVRCFRVPLNRSKGGRARYLVDYAAFFVCAALLVAVLDLRHRYAAVQVNTMPDALAFAAFVPRLRGARVVVFMKEPSPELAEITFGAGRVVRVMTMIEQAVLRWTDAAFTVTEQLKQVYVSRGADPEKIHVVLNGPDPRFLVGSSNRAPSSQFSLLCHGTIEERYGHDTLLEAVRLARDDVPGLRLTVTGWGSKAEHLRTSIDDMGLQDSVVYLGEVPLHMLVELIRSADVGVVPMSRTAYSDLVHTNKMFDFIAVGVPVVATRLCAVEAYFDDESLALVEPDDPKGMAHAIVDLYHHPESRRALAARASQLYARYGWDAQRRIYVETYEKILSRGRAR